MWQTARVKDACRKIPLTGLKIRQKEYLDAGRFPVVDQGQELIGGYSNDASFLIPEEPPFIVFGDHTKVKKFVNFKFIPGADGIKVLKPNPQYLPKFFYYALHIVKYPDKGYARHFQHVELTEIPLPPMEEQERIVAKIEELFSELDAGVEGLKKAQAELKTYRQSVLKHAFEGRLTNDNIKDGELPDRWQWTRLSELAAAITDGDHNPPPKADNGVPFITISNIDGNRISFENTFFVSQTYYDSLNDSRRPEKGDVLYTVTGSYGIPVLVDFDREFCFQRHIGLIRPLKSTNQRWLFYALQSPGSKNQADKLATGTAQKTVGLRSLRNFELPFCSGIEQQRVVAEIESRLSVCDKMEEAIKAGLKQAEALRQSILKEAFAGKPVPQQVASTDEKRRVYFARLQMVAFILKYLRGKGFRPKEMDSAKYVYLIERVFGVRMYNEYKRLHLGPYNSEIKKTIFNKSYFKHTSDGVEILNEQRLFNYPVPNQRAIELAIDDIVQTFLKYPRDKRIRKVELLATVCKVIEDTGSTDFDVVRASMKEWPIDLKNSRYKNKAEKFDETETANCIKFVEKKGWDKKLLDQNESG